MEIKLVDRCVLNANQIMMFTSLLFSWVIEKLLGRANKTKGNIYDLRVLAIVVINKNTLVCG